MEVLIIQPPIVQMNTPYPSGAYLNSFFKNQGHSAKWLDMNIELFNSLFCKTGLSRLFQKTQEKALQIAADCQKKGDGATAFNLRRYIAQKNLWTDWIDHIVEILNTKNSGFENAHRFVFGAHVPRGNRMDSFLKNLDHDLTTDDARSLASYAITDLADYITFVADPEFSLVRYAERLTTSENSFKKIQEGINSFILQEFYRPILEKKLAEYKQSIIKKGWTPQDNSKNLLVCISIPFAGTFTPGLLTGQIAREIFGDSAFISFGGGFVNTELRETKDTDLSKYCDALSFDKGYGSYKQLFENNFSKDFNYYKLRTFTENVVSDFQESNQEMEEFEKLQVSQIIPDFSDIDFSLYPRMIDDTNPMHRLWTDGAWIKAYMAHGCYWHKCAFCDTELDYVCSYIPTQAKKLFEGLYQQCMEKNIWGIHFVDEAMPPVMMVQFALMNIEKGSPITWWGNIRFEKYFTKDVAQVLAAGGLIGVSAGLESATGNGLESIHKGTDLPSIVSACCAFKEAGVLVHAYMIYGYWKEKEQDLINSMETLRQFYEQGLIDSCFWHKFTLTKHSRVYKEWSEGQHPELKPIDTNVTLFAKNTLQFKGEEKSEKYGPALNFSLDQWMHGQGLKKNVTKWFDFPVCQPSIPKDFIEILIDSYQEDTEKSYRQPLPQDSSKTIWLGGEKIDAGKNKVGWFYMGEYFEEKKEAPLSAYRGKGLCVI